MDARDKRLCTMVAAARAMVRENRLLRWKYIAQPTYGSLVVEYTTPVLDPDAIGHLLWWGDAPYVQGDMDGLKRETWDVAPLRGVPMNHGRGYHVWENATFHRVPGSLADVRKRADKLEARRAWPSHYHTKSMENVITDENGGFLGFLGYWA